MTDSRHTPRTPVAEKATRHRLGVARKLDLIRAELEELGAEVRAILQIRSEQSQEAHDVDRR